MVLLPDMVLMMTQIPNKAFAACAPRESQLDINQAIRRSAQSSLPRQVRESSFRTVWIKPWPVLGKALVQYVYDRVRNSVSSKEDCEELAWWIGAKLYHNLPTIRNIMGAPADSVHKVVLAWVKTVITNDVAVFYRKHGRKLETISIEDLSDYKHEDPNARADESLGLSELANTIRSLPPTDRIIISLLGVGFCNDDIRIRLSMRSGKHLKQTAATQAIHRARRRLTAML
jgi:DNA-directed RNA polymerase specialized sigma24 family protein